VIIKDFITLQTKLEGNFQYSEADYFATRLGCDETLNN